MKPETLKEWGKYIHSLSPEDLYRKAVNANQVAFVDVLKAEGTKPSVITGIFRLIAKRLVYLGIEIPPKREGGYIDYLALLDQERILNSVEVRDVNTSS